MKGTLQYIHVGESIRLLDENGSPFKVTCVESDGCDGCYFHRTPGLPQDPFCKAVACGDYERPDDKSVIFEEQKLKGGGE